MRVLLDTNVVLDLILEREGWVEKAEAIFLAPARDLLSVYISAITPGSTHYIARRSIGSAAALQAIADLLKIVRVCAVDLDVLKNAVSLPIADYEDAIQLASALAERLDAIVTRDLRDFKDASLPVFSPKDFLAYLTPPTNGLA